MKIKQTMTDSIKDQLKFYSECLKGSRKGYLLLKTLKTDKNATFYDEAIEETIKTGEYYKNKIKEILGGKKI